MSDTSRALGGTRESQMVTEQIFRNLSTHGWVADRDHVYCNSAGAGRREGWEVFGWV